MKANLVKKILLGCALLMGTTLFVGQTMAQERHMVVTKISVNNQLDPQEVLERLRALQGQVIAVDAVLQNSIDERERRDLRRRVRLINSEMAQLIAELSTATSARNTEMMIALPTAPPPEPPVFEEEVVEEEPAVFPMSDGQFNAFFQRWEDTAFEDDRRSLLRMGMRDNLVSVSQVRRLIKDRMGIMEDEALAIIDYLAPRIVDPNNAYTLIDVMTFSDGKKELEQILSEKLPR